MKKKVLKLNDVPETSFFLIGISSHENDYRLSWAINNQAHARFVRIQNYVFYDQKNNIQKEFSQYEYTNDELFIKYLLIANQSDQGYLIPEFKNFDYFIILFGEVDDHFIKNYIRQLNQVNIILMAMQINVTTLKSKGNLNFSV